MLRRTSFGDADDELVPPALDWGDFSLSGLSCLKCWLYCAIRRAFLALESKFKYAQCNLPFKQFKHDGKFSSHLILLFLQVPHPKCEFLCFLLDVFFLLSAASLSNFSSSFLIDGGTGFFNAELKMSIFKSLVLCDSCYLAVNLACVYRINVSMSPQRYFRMFVFKLSNFQPLTKNLIKQLTSKPIIVYFKNANVLYLPDYSVCVKMIYLYSNH